MYMYMYMYMHMYVCMYVCVCMYVYIYRIWLCLFHLRLLHRIHAFFESDGIFCFLLECVPLYACVSICVYTYIRMCSLFHVCKLTCIAFMCKRRGHVHLCARTCNCTCRNIHTFVFTQPCLIIRLCSLHTCPCP
jgi:hypothetical protein